MQSPISIRLQNTKKSKYLKFSHQLFYTVQRYEISTFMHKFPFIKLSSFKYDIYAAE